MFDSNDTGTAKIDPDGWEVSFAFLNFISDKFLKEFFWASHPYVKAKVKWLNRISAW